MELTNVFTPASANQWRDQIKKELKLEHWESIQWQNENGITIDPFYTAENQTRKYLPAFTHREWDICVGIDDGDAIFKNQQLLKGLQSGTTAIHCVFNNENPSVLLKDIELNFIRSSFDVQLTHAESLLNYLHQQYSENLQCVLFCSTITGEKERQQWKALQIKFPRVSLQSADVLPHHNANCTAVTELGLALASITEQLNAGINHPIAHIKMGIGGDYFIELAKFRALHRLWLQLSKHFSTTAALQIQAETSLTNKTVSDAYNNLLRTTTESMSAVLGGCHAVRVHGYDVLQPQQAELAFRMSINQQLILREEALLSHFSDVACGSWFIEHLTDALAEKALQFFKEIESLGGYDSVKNTDYIQQRISREATLRNEKIESGEKTIIGINKFKNNIESLTLQSTTAEKIKKAGIVNPAFEYELKTFFHNA